jgi:hypothetical protein
MTIDWIQQERYVIVVLKQQKEKKKQENDIHSLIRLLNING